MHMALGESFPMLSLDFQLSGGVIANEGELLVRENNNFMPEASFISSNALCTAMTSAEQNMGGTMGGTSTGAGEGSAPLCRSLSPTANSTCAFRS